MVQTEGTWYIRRDDFIFTGKPTRHTQSMAGVISMKRITRISNAAFTLILCVLAFVIVTPTAFSHDTQGHARAAAGHGKSLELGTSAAIDKAGRLWVVTKETTEGEQFVILQS